MGYVDNSLEEKCEEEERDNERIFIFILYPRTMVEAALKASVRKCCLDQSSNVDVLVASRIQSDLGPWLGYELQRFFDMIKNYQELWRGTRRVLPGHARPGRRITYTGATLEWLPGVCGPWFPGVSQLAGGFPISRLLPEGCLEANARRSKLHG